MYYISNCIVLSYIARWVCCAVVVFLALYVVYVLVVVFGRVIYQYYKQRSAPTQQASINVVTGGGLFSLSLSLTVKVQ